MFEEKLYKSPMMLDENEETEDDEKLKEEFDEDFDEDYDLGE